MGVVITIVALLAYLAQNKVEEIRREPVQPMPDENDVSRWKHNGSQTVCTQRGNRRPTLDGCSWILVKSLFG